MKTSKESGASTVFYRIAIATCFVAGCFFTLRSLQPQLPSAMPRVSADVFNTQWPSSDIEQAERGTNPQTLSTNSNQSSRSNLVTTNIEDIRLGQRVVGTNPLREQTQPASDIDPKTWRAVRLTMYEGDVKYDLAFLRSKSWLEATGARVGGSIHMELDEMGLNGPADVIGIDPCPEIEPEDGTGRNVVTGTMAHPGPNILYLDITALDEPLGVTDTHPIWSESRQDFVVAGQLHVGEQFRTLTGETATLTKITPHRGPPKTVFNLEVDAQHVYAVANNGLLVHNDCGTATVTGSSSHVGVSVTDGAQTGSTHVNGIVNATIENADGWIFGKTAKYLDDVILDLPDATSALAKQRKLLGKSIDYALGKNDCVSHVKDILRAGGLDVSSLPSTVEGFLDALRRLN